GVVEAHDLPIVSQEKGRTRGACRQIEARGAACWQRAAVGARKAQAPKLREVHVESRVVEVFGHARLIAPGEARDPTGAGKEACDRGERVGTRSPDVRGPLACVTHAEFAVGRRQELRHAHRAGPGAAQPRTREAVLKHQQRRDELFLELLGQMALPGECRQNPQNVRAAGRRPEIALDRENGERNLARHAETLLEVMKDGRELAFERAPALDARFSDGASDIGRDRDSEFGLDLWLDDNAGVGRKLRCRALEGFARNAGGLGLWPEALHEGLEILSLRQNRPPRCAKAQERGEKRSPVQPKPVARKLHDSLRRSGKSPRPKGAADRVLWKDYTVGV